MEEIIARFVRKHPHFATWAGGLPDDPANMRFQFAVIDRWRSEPDVDALYVRLSEETETYASRLGRCPLPMPTRDEFAETVKLYLPMVCGISWQRMKNLPEPVDPAAELARIKRSR